MSLRSKLTMSCGLLLLVLFTGALYERVASYRAGQADPPMGKMVDVNGRKLHVISKGDGSPGVVFESGLDLGGHLSWSYVQEKVAGFTSTLSYDRPGILWSENKEQPGSCRSMAADLHELLEKSQFPKPYILVGHSFGGLSLRCFIASYPEEVAAVLLVEASHPDLLERTPAQARDSATPIPRWQMTLADHLGIARLFLDISYPRINHNDPINIRVGNNGLRSLDGLYNEMQGLEAIMEDASKVTTFQHIPLLVVSANHPERSAGFYQNEQLRKTMDRLWADLQTDMLSLSTNSRQIMAHKSGHYVQLEQPELIASAIRFLVDCTKSSASKANGLNRTQAPSGKKHACNLLLF